MKVIIIILLAGLINNVVAQNYLKKGGKLFDQGYFADALINFSKAHDEDPEEPGIVYNMALCKLNLNDYTGCIDLSNKAIEMDSSNASYFFCRARCKNGLQDHVGAIDDYTSAITLDQKDFSYCNRANTKLFLEDYKGALEDFNKAIELNPKDHENFSGRAYVKTILGQNTEAISDYLKCLEFKPADITALLSLSELYLITRAYDKAIQYAKKIDSYPKNTEEETLRLFFIYSSGKLAKQDVHDVELILHKKLTQEFSTTWSFTEIENFLMQEGIPSEAQLSITEIIEKFENKIKSDN